ncbi:MAG TPA: phosphoglycerate kinase [Patescibacteria group bacterium]
MNIPNIKDTAIDISGKKVLVRLDLDTPEGDLTRLEASLSTLNFLLEKNCQVTVIGHKGRPTGNDPSLSVLPFKDEIEKLLNVKDKIEVLENLRFNGGEEKNDLEFAKSLAQNQDFFVNEAFASSHRSHASIVALPSLLPHAAGIRFSQEVENLSKVFEDSKRPVVVIISGVKDDKVKYVEEFLKMADMILIGGRLPDYIHDASPLRKNPKVIVAGLIADKEDISLHAIEDFEKEIAKAKTIVLSGPLGKFEEEGHRQGTQRVFKAVVESDAYKVAGGGDTERAISLLSLKEKFDWVSVGGGAMLEFLSYHTLPGIKALLQK